MEGHAGNLVLRLALVATLLAGALALWLSASGAGHAATADQTQSMQATVLTTLSWGSAGSCTQNMAALDFGPVTPGVQKSSGAGTFTGCVTSSLPFSVSAVGTTPMTSGANSIAFSGLYIYQQFSSWTTASACTVTESCPLDTSRSILTNAPAATGKAINYTYGVKPPPTQAPGTYTGGVVTFTASN